MPQMDDEAYAATFRRLFEAEFGAIRRYLYRYVGTAEDARDLAHDTFVKLWERRYEIDFASDLRGYMYQIARREAIDALRRRRVVERYLAAEANESAVRIDLAADPTDALAEQELAAALQKAIDALPARRREVLTLRWRRQMSYDEIAAALGLSVKTVANHLFRACEELRRSMQRHK